jgi:hypothetical protein
MTLLAEFRQSGFELSVNDRANIEIKPFDKLTQSQVEFLKSHKAAIINELRAEQTACDIINKFVTCWTPSGIPIEVETRDDAHKAYLLRMNPQASTDLTEAIKPLAYNNPNTQGATP